MQTDTSKTKKNYAGEKKRDLLIFFRQKRLNRRTLWSQKVDSKSTLQFFMVEDEAEYVSESGRTGNGSEK